MDTALGDGLSQVDVSTWALELKKGRPKSRLGRSKKRLLSSKSSVSVGGDSHASNKEKGLVDTNVDMVDSDMTPEMQNFALSLMKSSVKQSRIYREIAELCKTEMDKTYGPSWQCVVGREYGIRVGHESGHFLFTTVEGLGVLLFKSE